MRRVYAVYGGRVWYGVYAGGTVSMHSMQHSEYAGGTVRGVWVPSSSYTRSPIPPSDQVTRVKSTLNKKPF